MVLRWQPAYISLTARRAQPAGPPPTQPTTTTTNPPQMREIHEFPLDKRLSISVIMRPWRGAPGTDENVRAALAGLASSGCNLADRLGRRRLYLVP